MRLRGGTVAGEVALAGLLCALDLVLSWDPAQDPGRLPDWAVPGYAVAGYAVLLGRRRFPGPVLAVLVAHSLLAWALGGAYVPTLGVWLALYTVSARLELRPALAGLAAAFLPAAVNAAEIAGNQVPGERLQGLVVSVVMGTLVNVALFGLGRWTRWTVRQRRLVAARAAADATAAERARIARDLHDVVAHAITLMLLQAGGAARLLRADPERAETALRHVEDLGQQAIVELRRMLGLVVTSDAGYEVPAEPATLANVGALVERVRANDVAAGYTVEGEPVELDTGADLSAYRIVQEALTNATRYADRQHPIEVAVRWRPDHVEITVVNHRPADGPRPSRLSIGRGLIGMRERAHAVGGRVTAGPRADGTFAVTATLPAAADPITGAGPAGRGPARTLGHAGTRADHG